MGSSSQVNSKATETEKYKYELDDDFQTIKKLQSAV